MEGDDGLMLGDNPDLKWTRNKRHHSIVDSFIVAATPDLNQALRLLST